MLTISQYRDAFLEHLEKKVKTKEPVNLYKPITYILNLGGKRLRPVLVLMSAEIFDTSYEKALDAALAIEVFHNFSLVAAGKDKICEMRLDLSGKGITAVSSESSFEKALRETAENIEKLLITKAAPTTGDLLVEA